MNRQTAQGIIRPCNGSSGGVIPIITHYASLCLSSAGLRSESLWMSILWYRTLDAQPRHQLDADGFRCAAPILPPAFCPSCDPAGPEVFHIFSVPAPCMPERDRKETPGFTTSASSRPWDVKRFSLADIDGLVSGSRIHILGLIQDRDDGIGQPAFNPLMPLYPVTGLPFQALRTAGTAAGPTTLIAPHLDIGH